MGRQLTLRLSRQRSDIDHCLQRLLVLLSRDQTTHVFEQRPGFRRDGQPACQQVTQQYVQAAAGVFLTAVGMVHARRHGGHLA
jgi:hypothetical protein